jgi:hypothetical protein
MGYAEHKLNMMYGYMLVRRRQHTRVQRPVNYKQIRYAIYSIRIRQLIDIKTRITVQLYLHNSLEEKNTVPIVKYNSNE